VTQFSGLARSRDRSEKGSLEGRKIERGARSHASLESVGARRLTPTSRNRRRTREGKGRFRPDADPRRKLARVGSRGGRRFIASESHHRRVHRVFSPSLSPPRSAYTTARGAASRGCAFADSFIGISLPPEGKRETEMPPCLSPARRNARNRFPQRRV